MKLPKSVDGALLDWGAALFNTSPVRRGPQQRTGTGLLLGQGRWKQADGGRANTVQSYSDARRIRGKLGGIARGSPEVLVKISGGGKGMKQIRGHLDYISRHGQLALEDQDGQTIQGRDCLITLSGEWQTGGIPLPDESTRREAFNLVLSMPEGTDPEAVRRAVTTFASNEFAAHQYVMALHTRDTDPDPEPSAHPHVHLCVKATSFEETRLNPRKADLQRWREAFCEALLEQGVEASATNRQQRLQQQRSEKQVVRILRERGERLERVGQATRDKKRVAKARETQRKVLGQYREIAQALAVSEAGEDRRLAHDLIHRLDEQIRMQGRDRGGDRGRAR